MAERYANALPEINAEVEHISKFISGLWQIHAFGEGNTRTTAVFTIKYLRTFGFNVDNDLFAVHSWYFRNALVRANFNDAKLNIHATTEYLMQFFGNLLFGEHNELKNRYLHIKEAKLFPAKTVEKTDTLSDNNVGINKDSVGINVGIKPNILNLMAKNGRITTPELAGLLNVSTRTIERHIRELQQGNIIKREGARKNGYWKIIDIEK
ncbi:MAG: winged helix-turn-helix transcriptional regulator [Fusobacteriaceae bacterium]|nr:winged helix-turn-helix transcriptional regulator [Fusobacteriaceae bacterium]